MKGDLGTVLVVDDSRLIRKMLSSQLGKNGYTVSVAEDGNHAIELLKNGSFDIVLMDILMPGVNGMEVLKTVRKKKTETELPIIMVTSQEGNHEIVNALSSGANDYITKPVDISVVLARISTQLKLKKYSHELEESNRLKDLFIDIMGHDLLKPADIARMSAELILEQEKDEEKIKVLKNIIQSNSRIIDLIENASVLAKLGSGDELELKEDDLGSHLKNAVSDNVGYADQKNIKIEVQAQEEFPANLNPLIYDVFSNLLGNAIKYSPENSKVNASISGKNEKWVISISDQGEGIPNQHKKGIFNRFKRLEKGGVKGTGLGLAIAKAVVEAHKGKIWVEDNIDKGSTFFVELPKA